MKTKKSRVAKKSKKAAKPVKQTQVRSKAARSNIAEGTRLFALAGRPTKAQFVKVYGPKGPTMTWVQRARRVLTPNTSKRRSRRSPKVIEIAKALGRRAARGLCLWQMRGEWGEWRER
jgi:hypothetical protein